MGGAVTLSRRPGVGTARRVGFRGIGGGSAARPRLDLFEGGTFTRSSEASYLTGPATDGSSAFMAWATTNTRRVEYDAGLSGGTGLLMEASRQNVMLHSEDFTQAAWTKSLVTVTGDAGNAPDGDADADDLAFDANAAAEVTQTFTAADSARVQASMYLRCTSGTESVILRVLRKDGTYVSTTCTVTTTWQRFEVAVTSVLTGGSTPTLSLLNGDASARTVRAWGAQVTTGAEASAVSSYIRTGAAAVTRAVDVLSYADGLYPASFRSAGFRLSAVPLVDSPIAAVGRVLVSTAGDQFVRFFGNAFQLNTATGSVSPGCTWSRGQVLTVSASPAAGTILLSGFTTGNGTSTIGTPSTWSTTTLLIGQTNALFRFGRFVEAL
jgi:hypothetical protein